LALGDFGVLALRGPNGVSLLNEFGQPQKVSGDTAALLVFALMEYASKRKERIAIGTCPAARHLPLITVAGRTLAKTVAGAMYGAERGTSGLLFVSVDLDVRSRYCDLFVAGSQIDQVHPGSRLRPQGDRVPLTPGRVLDESSGVCFYLPRGELPRRIDFKPSIALMDFRYSRFKTEKQAEIIAWIKRVAPTAAAVCLYTIGDTDTRDTLLKSSLNDVPLDQYALQLIERNTENPLHPASIAGLHTSLNAADSYLNRQHRFIAVPGGTADPIITTIGSVLDEHASSDSGDLRRARWLLATMRQLPVPLVWYEQTASARGRSTLRRLIARIGVMSRHQGTLGAVLQSLRIQFDLLYRAMEGANPRAEIFAQTLGVEAPKIGESLLVITRDPTIAKAVRSWVDLQAFHTKSWLDSVDVRACSELSSTSERRYSKAIVCGMIPKRYRWIIGAALADEVIFLTADHETSIAERQLHAFFDTAGIDASQKRLEKTLNIVGCSVRSHSDLRVDLVPQYRVALPKPSAASRKTVPRAKGGSLADLGSLVAKVDAETQVEAERNRQTADRSWRADAGDEEFEEEVGVEDDSSAVDQIDAIRINGSSAARGPSALFLPEHVPVEAVLGARPNELTSVLPGELEAGDVVLLMEEGGRTDLFDRIVELAEGTSELGYLSAFRKQWRDALSKIEPLPNSRSALNYNTLLAQLQHAGAPIQNWQTVRNWILGITIAPDDPRSIAAVGKISGAESLVRNVRDFDHAFRRIRGIRQGIGRQLNSAIRRHFAHFATGVAEGAGGLDPRLGIPLDELIETIDFLEVDEVAPEAMRISPARAGRLISSERRSV
jgi:hypothetical protein